MNGLDAMIVAGCGDSSSVSPDMFEARTRATVRYADPAAWIIANAVARALATFGHPLTTYQHEVGMVVVSDQGPSTAMGEIQAAASAGFSSPLRYAASNPGSLVAVTCIAFGFRGPTLNLTMRPEDGVPVAIELCAGWLTRRTARWMLLATCKSDPVGTGLGRAILFAPKDPMGKPDNFSMRSAAEWLKHAGEIKNIYEESAYTEAH
jgi:hypothetical protein